MINSFSASTNGNKSDPLLKTYLLSLSPILMADIWDYFNLTISAFLKKYFLKNTQCSEKYY